MTLFDPPSAPDAPPAKSAADLSRLALDMYFKSDQARQLDTITTHKDSTAASRPLQWLAIVKTFGLFLLYAVLQKPLAANDITAWRIIWVGAAMAAAYWGLWSWSLSAPLPAAIVGMLLFVSEVWFSLALQTDQQRAAHPSSGGVLILIITVTLLIKAIAAGSKHRQLLQAAASSNDAGDNHPRGIASGLFLYFILLGTVLTPIGLATNNDFTFKDQLDIYKLMAIIVLTWAAIAWRDTVSALCRPVAWNWLATGVICGGLTFLFATVYLLVINVFLDFKTADPAAALMNHGITWLGVVGLLALYPAIFEELAFRGIIVPCLRRALSEKETIAVSAMMFMMLHLSVPSAPHLLLLGLIAAHLRLRTGSIWPCVLLHFTHNFLCVTFSPLSLH